VRIVRLALAAVGVLAAALLIGLAVKTPPPPAPAPPQVVTAPAAPVPPSAPVPPTPPPAVDPPPADPPAPVAEPTPPPTPAPTPAPVPPKTPPAVVKVAAPAPVEPPPEPAKPEVDLIATAPPPQPPPPVDAEQTVRNTIKLSMTAFETCYQNSLRRDSRIKGKVMVTVQVLESGLVNGAKLKLDETTIKDEGVLGCITARLKSMRFPPLGEDVEVTLPLSLVPREN